MADLETINKLYLELSQFATAKTARELTLEKQLDDAVRVRDMLYECCKEAIPCENPTFDTYNADTGRMFQDTLKKALRKQTP